MLCSDGRDNQWKDFSFDHKQWRACGTETLKFLAHYPARVDLSGSCFLVPSSPDGEPIFGVLLMQKKKKKKKKRKPSWKRSARRSCESEVVALASVNGSSFMFSRTGRYVERIVIKRKVIFSVFDYY